MRPFKVYNSGGFSDIQSCVTTTLINFMTLERNPMSVNPPISNPRQPLIFLSVGLPTLDISCRWNHMISSLWCLASFT